MSYTISTEEPCRECGELTVRRERYTRDPLCLDCAVEKQEASVRQINARRGVFYERWIDGMAHAVERQRNGAPPPYKLPPRTDSGDS
jgi:hypothetical protein